MYFDLKKTSSETKCASYSLNVACYFCSIFVESIIYYVLVCELIPRCIAFRVHESSGEQHLYLTRVVHFPWYPLICPMRI